MYSDYKTLDYLVILNMAKHDFLANLQDFKLKVKES